MRLKKSETSIFSIPEFMTCFSLETFFLSRKKIRADLRPTEMLSFISEQKTWAMWKQRFSHAQKFVGSEPATVPIPHLPQCLTCCYLLLAREQLSKGNFWLQGEMLENPPTNNKKPENHQLKKLPGPDTDMLVPTRCAPASFTSGVITP